MKTSVLNDSTVRSIPELKGLDVFNLSILDKKPSLVHLYTALKKRHSANVMRKALTRAVNMRDHQIAAHVNDVDSFVLQLSNKDDRKRR